MPTDVFYGADAELRIGLMADKDTDPTAWQKLEFMSLNAAPTTERRQRAKLGSARNNALDPTKPRRGYSRVGIDLVIDGDTLQVPLWLRHILGAPTTTGPSSSIYTHVWNSGAKTPQYCAIQVRPTSGSKVYVYRAVTFGALTFNYTGEQTQDFDVQFSLKGISRTRVADWLSGTTTAVPAESPVNRCLFRMDGAAASDTLSGSFAWDRQLTEDLFASTTAVASGLRPGGGVLNGSANFRALGEAIEDIEEADTVFAPDHQMLGVTAGHEIIFAHLQALLEPGGLNIAGAGLQDRSWSWTGHQTSANPGARLTVKNGVTGYA